MEAVIRQWASSTLLDKTDYQEGEWVAEDKILDVVYALYQGGLNIMLMHATGPDYKPHTIIWVDDRRFQQR